MKAKVIDLDNKAAGDIELDDGVFGLEVRADLLQRAVVWQLAKRRAGTHATKGRSQVNGANKKPWRQKGTGRARAGSLKAGHFRGGGVTFGPHPRDHAIGLPKKVRKLALKTALSSKQAAGQLVVIDAAKAKSEKTKAMVAQLEKLGWNSALVIDGTEVDAAMLRAIGNLPGIDLLPQQGANVYDILRRDTLVLTRDAVEALEARLK